MQCMRTPNITTIHTYNRFIHVHTSFAGSGVVTHTSHVRAISCVRTAMARNRGHATAHATQVHPWSMPKPPATGGSRISAARGPTSCPAALMHLGVSQSERPSRGGAKRGHVWHPSASPRTKSAPSYVPADKRGRSLRGNFSQDLVELHSNGLPLLGAVQAPLSS